MSTETPKSKEEVAATALLKRKSSPSPLPIARDVGAAPRPLSPLRRAAVPLGLAGLLSAAAAAALVNAASDPPCPAHGVAPTGPYTRFSTGLNNLVRKFLDPTPQAIAGEMVPVSPISPPSPAVPVPIAPASINPPGDVPAATTPPAPTATPTTSPSAAKAPKHIEPTPHHPKLAGKPMPPQLNNVL